MVKMSSPQAKFGAKGLRAILGGAFLVLFLFGYSVLAMAQTSLGQVTVPKVIAHYPELILYNAKLVTMDDPEVNQKPGTIVEAIAIRSGEIMALGSNSDILRYTGPETKKVDLKARTVIPGLINTHTHVHDRALSEWLNANPVYAKEAVSVYEIEGETPDELKQRIEVVLKENVRNQDEGKWAFLNLPGDPEGRSGKALGVKFLREGMVTQEELDQWAPKNPILVVSHPSYLINTRGEEEIAKIYSVEPDMQMPIEEGRSFPSGYSPVGIEFRRSVIVDGYFRTNVPMLGEIILDGLEKAAAAGITTFVSHIQGINNFNAYMYLLKKHGRLPIRFAYGDYAGFQANPARAPDFYFRLGNRLAFGTEFFWQTGISLGFIDNNIPAICTSAELPSELKSGEWCRMAPGTPYSNAIYQLLATGQRIVVGHNYGDKTADYFMDLVEKAVAEVPGFTLDFVRSQRYTMDHCGLYPRPDQLPRMKKLGIGLVCDTGGLTSMYPWLEEVYGMDKVEWIAPIRRILEAGLPVAWSAEGWARQGRRMFTSFTPFITRKNEDGKVVAAAQAVDRVTVMKMATSWAARFIFKENVLGMLRPGYWADLVVLDRDYFTVPVEEIDRITPLMTVVGGEIVFLRESLARELGHEPIGFQIQYH